MFSSVVGQFTGAEIASLRESKRADYERLPEAQDRDVFSRLTLETERPNLFIHRLYGNSGLSIGVPVQSIAKSMFQNPRPYREERPGEAVSKYAPRGSRAPSPFETQVLLVFQGEGLGS